MTVYEIVAQKILDELSKGEIPWRKPWNGRTAKNLISKKEYRGMNRILLRDSEWWLTFNQAKGLGGHVKEGERSSFAVFWKQYTPPKGKEEEEDGREPGEISSRDLGRPFILRYYRVFRLDQCEIPADKLPPVQEDFRHDPIEAAEQIAAGYQDGPKVNIISSDRAFYSPFFDQVTVPLLSQYQSPAEYYETLFHELIHSTGHESRLKRIKDAAAFGSETYAKEELVAEMGAAFLTGIAGLENAPLTNAAAYIQGWMKRIKEDPKLLVFAAAAAEKAAEWIQGRRPGKES